VIIDIRSQVEVRIRQAGLLELLEVFDLFFYVQNMKTKSNIHPQSYMLRPLNLDALLATRSALYILNHYKCPECEHLWVDRWDGEVEDDCPGCGERHITPIESEDQRKLFKCRAITSVPGAFRS
jgi:hypothetical protein